MAGQVEPLGGGASWPRTGVGKTGRRRTDRTGPGRTWGLIETVYSVFPRDARAKHSHRSAYSRTRSVPALLCSRICCAFPRRPSGHTLFFSFFLLFFSHFFFFGPGGANLSRHVRTTCRVKVAHESRFPISLSLSLSLFLLRLAISRQSSRFGRLYAAAVVWPFLWSSTHTHTQRQTPGNARMGWCCRFHLWLALFAPRFIFFFSPAVRGRCCHGSGSSSLSVLFFFRWGFSLLPWKGWDP